MYYNTFLIILLLLPEGGKLLKNQMAKYVLISIRILFILVI